jgi:phosphohistidine phosphatase
MKLYLVQHAQPKPKEEDQERPLSEKGQTDICKIANFLAKGAQIKLNAIMHSGKMRAKQTAEVLTQYLHPPKGIKQTDGLDPLADPLIWIERLAEINEDTMLVGHLPHLAKLSALLLCKGANEKIIDFKMGGVICLKRDESDIWSILWMIIPQILT